MGLDSGLRDLLRAIAAADPGSQPYGLLLQGQGREARDVARSATELQPGVPIHHFRLVVVELSQGRTHQARQAAERLTGVAPADSLTAIAMALVLLAEHRWLEAEATITPFLREKPDDERAVWILALALEGQGRRDAALEAFAWLAARGRNVSSDAARASIWRAWRWYELGALGLMATILAHLAIEAFRTPYEGFVGRMLAIALVVTVAGLLVIVRRRRRRLESMSEDARIAVGAESERRRLEVFMETLPRALVIGGILVGLLLGQRALADASVLFEDLPVGTCFDWPPESVTPRVAPIPCDKPHHLELIAVVHYPSAADSAYPGFPALTAYGDRHCQRAFLDYVGIAFDDQADLAVDPRFAIEGYWEGHHDIYCTIRDPDWEKLRYTMRDAAR
jgi:putative regulator of septum formation/tetratricopeptide repeat protein